MMSSIAALVLLVVAAVSQGIAVTSAQANAFMGTWVVTMTEPEALKGSVQTVRIWDHQGSAAASVQVGQFPATTVTGIVKDGDMLVLTISHDARPGIREDGAPIWAVISLTLDDDSMKMAQMMERSQTIKRGIGTKQP